MDFGWRRAGTATVLVLVVALLVAQFPAQVAAAGGGPKLVVNGGAAPSDPGRGNQEEPVSQPTWNAPDLTQLGGVPAMSTPKDIAWAKDGTRDADATLTVDPTAKVPAGQVRKELVGQRRANRNVYLNADGTVTAELRASPGNVRDAGGNWVPKDTRVTKAKNGRFGARVTQTPVDLAPQADDAQLAALDLGGNKRVSFALRGAARAPANVAADEYSVTYADVAPNTDLELEPLVSGVKETLTLKRKGAPNAYSFDFTTGGLTPKLQTDGSIALVDDKGSGAGVLPAPFMVDSKYGATGEVSFKVHYELGAVTNGVLTVKVVADQAWLDDPARVYPVKIDPTVAITNRTDPDKADDTMVIAGWDPHDWSTFPQMWVGSNNGGASVGEGYLQFDTGFLLMANVKQATLTLGQEVAGTCDPRPMEVRAVRQAWSGSTMTGWPGAASDPIPIATPNFNHTAACGSPNVYEQIDVTKTVQGWVLNQPAFGFHLRVPPGYESDPGAFKAIAASERGASGPTLNVQYYPINVRYDGATWLKAPTASQAGQLQLKIGNTGQTAFNTTDTKIHFDIYTQKPDGTGRSASPVKSSDAAFTSNIAQAFVGTTNVALPLLPVPATGLQYLVLIDTVHNTYGSVAQYNGGAKLALVFDEKNLPPVVTASSIKPLDGKRVGTTTPTFTASATDPDNYPGKGFTWRIAICTAKVASPWGTDTASCPVHQQAAPPFTPAYGVLDWNNTYYWKYQVMDGTVATGGSGWVDGMEWASIFTNVPLLNNNEQSHYGWDPYGDNEYGVQLAIGNLVARATDVNLPTVGPALSIDRTYNSKDASVGLFGKGWSHPLDMKLTIDPNKNATIRYPDGRRIFFGWKWSQNKYVAAEGYRGRLYTDATGWWLTEPDGTKYKFDSGQLLTWIRDPEGQQLNISRGLNSFTLTDATSLRHLFFATNAAGRVIAVTTDGVASNNGAAYAWSYSYDATDPTLVRSVCGPDAQCTTYDYTNGLLTAVKSPSGTILLGATYDAGGKVVTRSDGGGLNVGFQYSQDSQGRLVVTVNGQDGRVIKSTFDDAGRMVERVNPIGRTRSFVFNQLGFLTQLTDEFGKVATYTVDDNGNVVAQTSPTNATTYYEYFSGAITDDRTNKLVALRDPRSSSATDNTYRTTFEYDTSGRMTARTEPPTPGAPAGRRTSWAYSAGSEAAYGGGAVPAGLLLSETGPNGAAAVYEYDSRGDLRRTTDQVGLKTEYTYDEIGRQVSEKQISDSYPNGLVTRYAYDSANRLSSITAPAVLNRVTNLTSTLQTTTTYDANGFPSKVVAADITGPSGTRTTLSTYDAFGRRRSETDPAGGATQWNYDGFGNNTEVIDAAGRRTVKAFTTRDQLQSVILKGYVDPNVNAAPRDITLLFQTWDGRGELATSVDELGRKRVYGYNDDATVRSVTLTGYRNRDGSTRDFIEQLNVYDKAGNATTVYEGNKVRRTDYTYDAANYVTQEVLNPSSVNRVTAYRYDGGGNRTWVRVSLGGRTDSMSYGFDAAKRMTAEVHYTDAASSNALVWFITRDQRGLPITKSDPRSGFTTTPSFTTNVTYDEAGRKAIETLPIVSVEENGVGNNTRPEARTGYNAFGEVTDQRDARGNVTTTAYDVANRKITQSLPPYTPAGAQVPLQPSVVTTTDAVGNTTSVIDRLGRITSMQYDSLNRAVKLTQPALNGTSTPPVATVTYDDAGNRTAAVDPTGARMQFTYDDLNRVRTQTQVVRNGSSSSSYVATADYDDLGNRNFVVDPAGNTSTAVYDSRGLMVSATDPAGKTASFGYDGMGRTVSVTDPMGRKQARQYDFAGRPTVDQRLSPDGVVQRQTTHGFDAAGNLTADTDALGNTTTRGYDALNRVTTMSQPLSAGVTAMTAFGYDANGNRTRVTDARGQSTISRYTPWNQTLDVVEPATTAQPIESDRRWRYSYDANGNAVKLEKPGGVVISRSFDELGRVTQESGSGGSSIAALRAYSYDLAGRITSAGQPDGTQSYSYDDRGLMTSSSGPAGASVYAYDADGRMTSRTVNGAQTTFAWNSRSQLETVNDAATAMTTTTSWNDAGQKEWTAYGSTGPLQTFAYDGIGQPFTVSWKSRAGVVLHQIDYRYDLNGNITSRIVSPGGVAGAGTHGYEYDQAGRLAKWTSPNNVVTQYGYDAAGNRTLAGSTAYTYDERNRLVSEVTGVAGTSYGWSPAGDLVSKTATGVTTASTFDAFDRLVGDGSLSYAYDATDRLAKVTNGSVVQRFQYAGLDREPTTDGSNRLVRDVSGALVAYGTGSSLGGVYETDMHGDVVGVLSMNNTLVNTRSYDPWGTPMQTTGTVSGVSAGYQGQYTAPNGRVHMDARWYTPGSGAFTSRDDIELPFGSANSFHRYAYANATPINGSDPSGHILLVDDLVVIAAVVAVAAVVTYYTATPQGRRATQNASDALVHLWNDAWSDAPSSSRTVDTPTIQSTVSADTPPVQSSVGNAAAVSGPAAARYGSSRRHVVRRPAVKVCDSLCQTQRAFAAWGATLAAQAITTAPPPPAFFSESPAKTVDDLAKTAISLATDATHTIAKAPKAGPKNNNDDKRRPRPFPVPFTKQRTTVVSGPGYSQECDDNGPYVDPAGGPQTRFSNCATTLDDVHGLVPGLSGSRCRPVGYTPTNCTNTTGAAVASVDDLTGSTLSNYNRFVKNLPAAAEQPTITSLPGGGFEFSANVPASKIPGSYATYAKVVDANGVTTSFIKTTIAPDGSIVSVKVKYP